MTQKPRSTPNRLTIIAMVALAVLALPLAALANTTADTAIVNVVRVDYKDAGGTQSFAAEAAAIVVINLVEAPLLASGPPTDTLANPALSCLSTSVPSGGTATSLFALTATANGDDIYNLTLNSVDTDVANVTRTYQVVNYNGVVLGTDPATYELGSAVVVGYNAATLYFPGGTIELADFAENDIVVVEGVSYLVASASAGNAASHANSSQGTLYNSASLETPEVQGSLTLKGWNPATTINGVTVGGSSTPSFTNTVVGTVAAEQILVLISVKADATGAGNGTVAYTFSTAPDGDGTETATIECTVTFTGTQLRISKEARVSADGINWGTWGAVAGNPGDYIEYQVTVENTGGVATQVVVTDAVPAYTTLIETAYNGNAAFATVIYTVAAIDTTIYLTAADNDTENGSYASGDADGTAAESPLTFYLGDGNVGFGTPAGGIMASGDSAVITYQVQID